MRCEGGREGGNAEGLHLGRVVGGWLQRRDGDDTRERWVLADDGGLGGLYSYVAGDLGLGLVGRFPLGF